MASDLAQVIHLLRRSGFGGPHPEAASLATQDLGTVVDRVLDFSLNPAPARPAIVDDPNAAWWDVQVALTWFWLDRMANVPSPLQEKLALFWHGHLATSQSKVADWPAMYDQNALFRSAGGGSFLDLVQQMSVQPAMLLWLDNGSNVAGAPNENFGRELMELFTAGREPVHPGRRGRLGAGVDRPHAERVERPRLRLPARPPRQR